MPPEALRRRRFSEKSDVWAFGVTAWEIFTDAEVPYAELSSDERVHERVLAGARLPEPARCPPPMWALMRHCWAETPEARPSFMELAAEMPALPEPLLGQAPSTP